MDTLFQRLCAEIDQKYAILSDGARSDLKRMLERMAQDSYDRGSTVAAAILTATRRVDRANLDNTRGPRV